MRFCFGVFIGWVIMIQTLSAKLGGMYNH